MDVASLVWFGSGILIGLGLVNLDRRLRRYQARMFNRAIILERLYEVRNGRKSGDLTVPREMIS